MDVKTPSNRTWNSGLLRRIPLGRGQVVEASPSQAVFLVVFKMRHAASGIQPANLVPEALLRPGSAPFRVPLVGFKSYVCIAVETAPRPENMTLKFQTRDTIQGTIGMVVTYNMQDPVIALQREDLLRDFEIECQSAVQRAASQLDHREISVPVLENTLLNNGYTFLGVRVERVQTPNPIQWRGDILALRRENVMHEINSNERRIRRERQIRNLYDMGITNPEIVLRTLAKDDPEMQSVLEAAEAIRERDKAALTEDKQWLVQFIESDMVDRTQLEDFIDGLVGRVVDDGDDRGHTMPLTGGSMGSGTQGPMLGMPPQALPPAQLGASTQAGQPQPPPQLGPSTQAGQPQPPPPPDELIARGDLHGNPIGAFFVDVKNPRMRLPLYQGETRIGRQRSENHIVVADKSVSRVHAVVYERAGQFYIRNYQAGRMTAVNGAPIGDTELPLPNGSEVIFSYATARLRLEVQQRNLSQGTNQHHDSNNDETQLY
jgi:hypothetical protein